jgi:hypothetical protein
MALPWIATVLATCHAQTLHYQQLTPWSGESSTVRLFFLPVVAGKHPGRQAIKGKGGGTHPRAGLE